MDSHRMHLWYWLHFYCNAIISKKNCNKWKMIVTTIVFFHHYQSNIFFPSIYPSMFVHSLAQYSMFLSSYRALETDGKLSENFFCHTTPDNEIAIHNIWILDHDDALTTRFNDDDVSYWANSRTIYEFNVIIVRF